MKKKDNPWFTIWRFPEKTISRLVSAKSNDQVRLITALLGISIALSSFAYTDFFGIEIKSKYLSVFYAIISGAVGSLLYVNVGSYYLSFIGSKLSGSGKSGQVKLAIIWSSVPLIVAIPFWIPATILDLFLYDIQKPMLLVSLMFIGTLFNSIGRVLHIFSFAYFVRMLAAVHHFSGWKSFSTIVIGALSVMIPLSIVYYLFVYYL